MLTLYHHGSSACAAKVRFALAKKGLPWTSCYVDIMQGEQFRPEFIALNPKAVVPVLVDDGCVIAESTIICEYLDEAYPQHPIYPRSPRLRAEVRKWTKAVDEELHPACSALTYVVSHRHTLLRQGVTDFEDFLARGTHEGRAARLLKWQWIQHGVEAPGVADKLRLYEDYLHKMESSLARSPWLVGGEFSMADIALAPYINRLHVLAMARLWSGGRLPHLESWFQRIREGPTFQASLVDWVPADLDQEMRRNGEQAWPQIEALLRKSRPQVT